MYLWKPEVLVLNYMSVFLVKRLMKFVLNQMLDIVFESTNGQTEVLY